MNTNVNFFDHLDSKWSDALDNIYEQTAIDTNVLIIYDLKKYGLEKFKKINVCNSIIKHYKNNVDHSIDTDEILLSIKLKNDINFDKHSYISNKQCSLSISYNDLEVLINGYNVMPYIIHSLAYDLGDNYIEEMAFLTFTIHYENNQFEFDGLEVAHERNIGKISFSKNHIYDLDYMKFVSFLNIKKFEPYIGYKKYKEMCELSKKVLPNADIN